MSTKTRSAGRCRECGQVMAVWQLSDDRIIPIGSTGGCPCGGSRFELLGAPAAAD